MKKAKIEYNLFNIIIYKSFSVICDSILLLFFTAMVVCGKGFNETYIVNVQTNASNYISTTSESRNIDDTAVNKSDSLNNSKALVNGSVYRIENAQNGYFLRGLNNTNNRSDNDAYISVYQSRPTWSTQKWTITKYNSQPYMYEIKNLYSDRALRGYDPNSSNPAMSGAKVTVHDPEVQSEMMWEFIPVKGQKDVYYIKNTSSGMYLNVASTSSYATQTSDVNYANVRWKLVPAPSSSSGNFLSERQSLQLSSIFGDRMVVQQNDSIAFFGKAVSGQKVILETLWGEVNSTVANGEGDWTMKILTPAASFDAQTIQIRTPTDTVLFKDVLIGEVWLCSGQSNMGFSLKSDDNGASEIANADNVSLRLFNVPSNTYPEPKENIENAQWQSCTATSLENFSAVAYYFGKTLSASLPNTPIGLVSAAFGSASVESFISKEALLSKPYLTEHYHNYTATVESKVPTACYNAMIHPLIPFAIKGIVWYQGEANCVRASHYYEALETMIISLRTEYNKTDMPFYIVQLPPYNYSTAQQEPKDEFSAATVREAQLKITENVENTGLVVTTDLGDVNNIHPTNKRPVGERLANLALHKSYGQKDKVFSGPRYKSYTVDGDKIRLTFDFVNNGIKDTYEELNWFTIAGSDKKFYQGNAFIAGNDIVVSSPYVDEPVALRFAWYNTAEPNFFNKEGLPASPFKTDEWTDFTYTRNITSWSPWPDIRNVPIELKVPELTEEKPAAGKRVKQTLAEYEGANVYHALYLPENWEKGRKYPVIVEYPGNGHYLNKYGDKCSGKPEDTYLGYGIGGGKDFIWIGMPFISADRKNNQLNWWGDIEASVDYTINTVKNVCNYYGGDSSLVFVSGFSRGAIACNYIGLHNDEIAKLWSGFIANSHYDGLIKWSYPDSDKISAKKRFQRLKGKPQIIIQENGGPAETEKYIENMDREGNFTYLAIPYRNHNLKWVLQDIPQRKILRTWVKNIVEKTDQK